jgi:GNAT superfamily N-acetyltransferase
LEKVTIREIQRCAESEQLDCLLWEILWKPLELPRNVRETFRLPGESLEIGAWREGELTGALVANWTSNTTVELRHLAVRTQGQRKGVGKQLVRHLVETALATGCSEIVTCARNTSLAFFIALGFVPVSDEVLEHSAFSRFGISFRHLRYSCGS